MFGEEEVSDYGAENDDDNDDVNDVDADADDDDDDDAGSDIYARGDVVTVLLAPSEKIFFRCLIYILTCLLVLLTYY